MSGVFIVSARRTPIGRFQGSLRGLSAPEMGAAAIRAAVKDSQLGEASVQEIFMGEVLTAGVGQAPARQAALLAGLPQSTQCTTVGKVCGSGMQAIILGAQSIATGSADVVVAGGQESMSRAPYLLPQAREGLRMGHKELFDSLLQDGLWDPYNNLHMGSCGELCAREFGLSRELQDAYAMESYLRARKAQNQGLFDAELVSLETKDKTVPQLDVDEEPTAANLDKMGTLRPAFEKNGTITAANASKLNDGASALMLASQSSINSRGVTPLARVVSWAGHAQDPKWFTTAPAEASRKALKLAGLKLEQIGLWEINEAFSLVAMVAIRQLGLSPDQVNVRGGAVALGHPIGASGARIVTTLVHALRQTRQRYGVATICIGGGEALALVVESL